jgi:hypothetical protein
MRSDMRKVITERPRGGGGIKFPKGEKRTWHGYDAEDYPKREKIRAKWLNHRGAKDFTDVLGPLYRYLLSQVGRKWDAVYSEICRNLPKVSVQNKHVFTHVWQFVARYVKVIDGVPCYNEGRWLGQPIVSVGGNAQLFVHPDNGLLCKAKKWRGYKNRHRMKPASLVPGIKVYPGVQYHKVGTIWYEVKVRKCTIEPDKPDRFGYSTTVKDEVLGRSYASPAEAAHVFGGNYQAVSKRPLNGREIKFAGLK